MATLNLGRIKPVFRGAYSGSTAYVVDDIVTHGNESFICIQAHGAGTQATSVAAYWTKLAAKGTDGTDVGTTITTQGDILFRDGSGLQRLAKGTAAQHLLMNSGATAPEWSTIAPATSDFVKLGTGTVSNASTFSIDGLYSATYKLYEYRLRGIYGTVNGHTVKLQFNTSGTAYTGSAYRGVMAGGYWSNSGATASQSSGSWGADRINVVNHSAFSEHVSNGTIQVYDPQNAGTRTYATFQFGGHETNVIYNRSGHGYHDANSAHTGITLSSSSGNIYVAECNVYGVK